MPSRIVDLFVLDILIAADAIHRFTRSIQNSYDLITDELVFAAVTRECEIIGGAMNNLLRSHDLQDKIKPEWRDVVDFRNVVAQSTLVLGRRNFSILFQTKCHNWRKRL